MSRRRSRGEQRRYRRALVGVSRDTTERKRPAGVETGRAEFQPSEHDRSSSR